MIIKMVDGVKNTMESSVSTRFPESAGGRYEQSGPLSSLTFNPLSSNINSFHANMDS